MGIKAIRQQLYYYITQVDQNSHPSRVYAMTLLFHLLHIKEIVYEERPTNIPMQKKHTPCNCASARHYNSNYPCSNKIKNNDLYYYNTANQHC